MTSTAIPSPKGETQLENCPFCGAAMIELERGNYAEHPWSEEDGFCHMRGFAVHRSRYDWWNRRSPSSSEDVRREALDEVHTFLLGEGPLDGRWFGDDPPVVGKRRHPYWWRKNLRAALSQKE